MRSSKRLTIRFRRYDLPVRGGSVFLRRQVSDVRPQADDLTANAKQASYKPLFGIGDKDADQLVGVARYGELTVAPGGSSAMVSYPAEEQMYFIEEGRGDSVVWRREGARQEERLPLPACRRQARSGELIGRAAQSDRDGVQDSRGHEGGADAQTDAGERRRCAHFRCLAVTVPPRSSSC